MSTKKQIGRIPISKGKYVAGQTYNRLSQVTLYGSTYQSMVDGNTSTPAILDENGNVQHANTDQWLVIADGSEAYNAGERTSCFSMEENPEYLAVETDADGKILSSTNADGSHYAYNLKSETIPEEFSHIDDSEERMHIITDGEGKMLAYRDKDGVQHEHKIEVGVLSAVELNLSEIGMSSFEMKLKLHGFGKGSGDWSNATSIHIPEPALAYANIEGVFPTTKGKTTKGKINFYDMQGNSFVKFIEMDIHGRTSSLFKKKNYTFDFYNDKDCSDPFTIQFGDWVSMDSFYIQGWYSDAFRGVDIIAYQLYQKMTSTLGFLKDRPYKYNIYKDATYQETYTNTNTDENFGKNALCTPLGFPIILYLNGEFWGIYTVMLKKNRANFLMDKKNYNAIMLDLGSGEILNGIKDWSSFEIRNPKTLVCIDGNKYNGDNPMELIDESSPLYSISNKDMVNTVKTKNAILGLANSYLEVVNADKENQDASSIKKIIESHYNVDYIIDYYIFSNVIQNTDGWSGNWQWTTWDGKIWNPNPYDLNSTFGMNPYGNLAEQPSDKLIYSAIVYYIDKYYKQEVKERYKALRDAGIISESYIIKLFSSWVKRIGSDNFEQEYKKWNTTPSQRDSKLNITYWKRDSGILPVADWAVPQYNENKSYNIGDVIAYNNVVYQSTTNVNKGNIPSDGGAWKNVTYDGTILYSIDDISYVNYGNSFMRFKCIKSCSNEPPLLGYYDEFCGWFGYYDSLSRIYLWLKKKIEILDNLFNLN